MSDVFVMGNIVSLLNRRWFSQWPPASLLVAIITGFHDELRSISSLDTALWTSQKYPICFLSLELKVWDQSGKMLCNMTQQCILRPKLGKEAAKLWVCFVRTLVITFVVVKQWRYPRSRKNCNGVEARELACLKCLSTTHYIDDAKWAWWMCDFMRLYRLFILWTWN